MIKGWRNDPRWIEHYAKRDEDRAQRQFERVKLEHDMAMLDRRIADSVERMKNPVKFFSCG